MSSAALRCPSCGSAYVRRTERQDEYSCSSCGVNFQLLRPGDHVVTHDIRAHNCPICGKPVESGKGFRCTKCGRLDVCSECVDKASGRYVCLPCLRDSGQDCQECGRFATWRCPSCDQLASHGLNVKPTRACDSHYPLMFSVSLSYERRRGDRYLRYAEFVCPRCGEHVCSLCAVKRRVLLSPRYFCRYCGSELRTLHGLVRA